MHKQLFKEDQKFQRWELNLLIGILAVGLVYRFIKQNYIHPVEDGISFVVFIFILAILGMISSYFMSLRLSVKITEESISFRYHPWQEKRYKIKWSEVADYHIVKTSESAQWNGWNIHYSNEKIYSVNGRNGIGITMKSGEQFFIGSKDVDGLTEAVSKVYP